MKTVLFPYGRKTLPVSFREEELCAVLTSSVASVSPPSSPEAEVLRALREPVGSPRLSEMAKGKKNVVVIASDHTRPVPSRILMPALLSEIRLGNPEAEITILIATGCHRGTTREELIEKFGEEIVKNERVKVHDCLDASCLVSIGILPSGGECVINRTAAEADLLLSEGFIEPHFFAGFSGGRKSVLPGIAGRSTVLANHCAEFIDHPLSRTGNLQGNPIHRDMLWAAKKAGLAFILNVVLNEKKEILYAVAGDPERAHQKGTDFLSAFCGVPSPRADLVISTNGGYPLDQNVYQAVKGMTAAEAAVRKGGVIIMLAQSSDGTGGDSFFRLVCGDPENSYRAILSRDRAHTEPDQWEAQILLRILRHAKVIYVSDLPDGIIEKMNLIPAHTPEEAMEKARRILGNQPLRIAAIPDGVSVMVRDQTEKGE